MPMEGNPFLAGLQLGQERKLRSAELAAKIAGQKASTDIDQQKLDQADDDADAATILKTGMSRDELLDIGTPDASKTVSDFGARLAGQQQAQLDLTRQQVKTSAAYADRAGRYRQPGSFATTHDLARHINDLRNYKLTKGNDWSQDDESNLRDLEATLGKQSGVIPGSGGDPKAPASGGLSGFLSGLASKIVGGLSSAPTAAPVGGGAGMIRVRDRATNRTGSVPAAQFDAKKYEKLGD